MGFLKIANVAVASVLDENSFNTRNAAQKIVEYDPEFVYVAVRALTADRPNSNGDSFPHEELVRIDPFLQRPVYASFIGKGIYINHKNTDDPTIAKGVILDARYVTADSNDKYVELLLGVDKQRDPIFAANIERGVINKFSMGASVQFTKCSVCDNEARRKEDFCDHIAKYKMRECVAKSGERKLAYEKCFGVTYNEISAVADPADETAQVLAKIAEKRAGKETAVQNGVNPSHGTVVLLNEINTRLKGVEAAVMSKVAKTTKRTAAPMPPAAPQDELGGMEPGAPGPDMGGAPGEELGLEQPNGGGEVIQVLDAIKQFAEGTLPAADLVEALEASGLGAEPAGPEGLPPGEEMGAPAPPAMDMAPQASRKSFSALVEKLAREYATKINTKREGTMATKNATESKSPKVDNQYPNMKPQGDPAQHHTKPAKGRPASDFDSDAKEYAKMWNVSARFDATSDRRTSGWVVADGNKDLFRVTGAGAWEDMLDQKWAEFSSREYGENLVKAILEDGLDSTMAEVNAQPVQVTPAASQPTTATKLDERMIQAAEAKAADLAAEQVTAFKERFLEGLSVAFELQSKNVIDNPIKAAAYEVLTAAGHDGALAERIADQEIVATHFEEAIKKAMEYTEMSNDSFEEVKAHVKSLPSTRVVEAQAQGIQGEDLENIVADVARSEMRKRASVNVGFTRTASGETPLDGAEDRIRSAIRSGISKTARMTPPTSDRPSFRTNRD